MKVDTNSRNLVQASYRDLWQVDQSEVNQFQLELLQKRFADLRSKVKTLDKLAELQSVDSIENINDVVPILFQHQAYKSYPMSLLEKGKFAALTKWLDKLTAHDLSAVDVSNCTSIDSWLAALEDQTPLMITHSSGTSGKLSLIPKDNKDTRNFTLTSIRRFEGFGDEPNYIEGLLDGSKKVAVVYPTYKEGRYSGHRLFHDLVECFGSKDKMYALYDDIMSADVVSLSGRVAGADAKGELDKLDIPDELLQKYKVVVQQRSNQKENESKFLEMLLEHCQGEDVILMGPNPMIAEWSSIIKQRGIERLFGTGTMMMSGGGDKNIVLEDGWENEVEQYIGTTPNTSYGMSECLTQYPICPEGNYHSTPYVIPFVLDHETGEPLPQEGRQTGRYAFFDLLAETYWGGFITGDKVNGNWGGCPCGRKGFYVENNIQRYSAINEGGDDKINCAGAANAHDKALEYLDSMVKTG